MAGHPTPRGDEGYKRQELSQNRRLVQLNFGLFVVALLSIGIAIWQSVIADRSASTAARAVQAQVDASRLDERAWVGVSEMLPPKRQVGEQLIVTAVFRNSGKTPARNAVFAAAAELVLKGQKPHLPEQTLPARALIQPDALFHIEFGQYDLKQDATDVLRINNREVEIWVHGRVDYEDIFGTKHWTTLCFQFVPGDKGGIGGFAACQTGNDTDDKRGG